MSKPFSSPTLPKETVNTLRDFARDPSTATEHLILGDASTHHRFLALQRNGDVVITYAEMGFVYFTFTERGLASWGGHRTTAERREIRKPRLRPSVELAMRWQALQEGKTKPG